MASEANPNKELDQQLLFADLVSNYQEGRDELNLAEFPISAVGNRLDPSVKTILFQDAAFDKSTGETITRKLTITASDQYGLPTAPDDEILLGLLQLSRIQNFETPTVTFTPYQLLKILGWSINTNNYRRLKESVNRWMGVTLYYENAWRDKRTGQWIDASFHFLEQVEFYKPGQESALAPEGYSVFKWNDIVFRNFREGNLKILDFHFYRSLEGGITKRLFRFLDKRFYKRKSLRFDLQAFACEKIGLTRPIKMNPSGRPTTDIAQIKRRLLKAIQELEAIGYIKSLPPSERFTKDSVGTWEVHFERQPSSDEQEQTTLQIEVEELSPLEGRLVGHGVSRSQARKLISEYEDTRIEVQLEALEFLLVRGGEVAPTNRGGWLVKAITENYSSPRGFKSSTQLAEESRQKAEKAKERQEAAGRKKAEEEAEQVRASADWEKNKTRILEYLESFGPEERLKIEITALMASPLGRGQLSARLRQSIIDQYVLDILDGRSAPE
jgi:replication initiator protein A